MGHGGALGTDTKIYKKQGLIVMFFGLSEKLPKQNEAFRLFEKTVRQTYRLDLECLEMPD